MWAILQQQQHKRQLQLLRFSFLPKTKMMNMHQYLECYQRIIHALPYEPSSHGAGMVQRHFLDLHHHGFLCSLLATDTISTNPNPNMNTSPATTTATTSYSPPN
jgi:hypothetical protein